MNMIITGGAGYKTLHKIAVRSYKQPLGGKNLRKNLYIKSNQKKVRCYRQPLGNVEKEVRSYKQPLRTPEKKRGLINSHK